MAQKNKDFPSTEKIRLSRPKIRDWVDALKSNFSGTSAPALDTPEAGDLAPVEGQFWHDSTSTVRRRKRYSAGGRWLEEANIAACATITALKALYAAEDFGTDQLACVFGLAAEGDCEPFFVKWAPSSSAAGDDLTVFRPTNGAAASGNGRWLIIGSRGISTVATKAALKAKPANFADVVQVAGRDTAGDGGGGTFIWNGANLSSQVSADTQEGVYIPKTGADGSAGAWVRLLPDNELRPAMFGAHASGSDESTALQAMISRAQALAAKCRLPKKYAISTALQVTSAITFVGEGKHTGLTGLGTFTDNELIQFTGAGAGASTSLSANAARFAKVLNVADASIVAAGDLIVITATLATYPFSQTCEVTAVDTGADTITLSVPLAEAIATGDTHSIAKTVHLRGVVAGNMSLEKGSNTGVNVHGLAFTHVSNSRLLPVWGDDLVSSAVSIIDGYSNTIEGVDDTKSGSSGVAGINIVNQTALRAGDLNSNRSDGFAINISGCVWSQFDECNAIAANGRGVKFAYCSLLQVARVKGLRCLYTGLGFSDRNRDIEIGSVDAFHNEEGVWANGAGNIVRIKHARIGHNTTQDFALGAGDIVNVEAYEKFGTAGDTVLSFGTRTPAAREGRPLNWISPFSMANNGVDATNDVDFTAFECLDSANMVLMQLGALTKRLDANWAAGTNQGLRNSAAAITDTVYNVFAVAKAGGASADLYAHTGTSLSTVLTALQAESGGADYVLIRRLPLQIRRVSGAIAVASYNVRGHEDVTGSYTPTLTDVTNIGAKTAYTNYFTRQGDVCRVHGMVDIDPTSATVNTQLRQSLPFASNLTTLQQVAGALASFNGAQPNGNVQADTTNDDAVFSFIPTSDANASWAPTFSYLIQ